LYGAWTSTLSFHELQLQRRILLRSSPVLRYS
jgi:hypothetical protein